MFCKKEKEQIVSLEKENEELRQIIANLEEENERLKSEISTLKSQTQQNQFEDKMNLVKEMIKGNVENIAEISENASVNISDLVDLVKVNEGVQEEIKDLKNVFEQFLVKIDSLLEFANSSNENLKHFLSFFFELYHKTLQAQISSSSSSNSS